MNIGYLGPKGTYCHAAALQFAAKITDANLVPVMPIAELFAALRNSQIDQAVVPLHNSIAGKYNETMQQLEKTPLLMLDVINMPIKLAIGIHPNSESKLITSIWSKDTALAECSEYLARCYSEATLIPVDSTAAGMAAIMTSELLTGAAIGSEEGLTHYGMKIIDRDIGNPQNNSTMFLMLGLEKDG